MNVNSSKNDLLKKSNVFKIDKAYIELEFWITDMVWVKFKILV